MNQLDKQYRELLQSILDYGVEKSDRTGTGTKSIFGYTIRHNMKDGFPLLTTKKMPFKTIVTELLWFLRGDTNIKFLVDNDCHIWNGDAWANYSKMVIANNLHLIPATDLPKTKEEFINKIKTDDEFAKKWGELGPIYAKQWRNWTNYTGDEINEGTYEMTNEPIDQIQNLINDLKTNPDSRRLMVTAWNPAELDQMVLPPCHYGFQVYTRELSLVERCDEYIKRHPKETNDDVLNYKWIGDNLCTHEDYDKWNIPTRAISLMWNQRSVDTFLGLPFNIASYGLLLEIIAKEVNMVPDQLIGNLGDTHLYLNHIEQAKEQIGRKYTPEERELMLKDAMSWRLYNKAVNELMPFGGGMSEYYDIHKIPYRTREPFPLPKLMFLDEYHYMNDIKLVGEIPFTEKINQFRPDFFKIENYQSHPSIKGELSN
jgi:thymidylate synthase